MCYWKINHYRVIRNPLTNRSQFRYTTQFTVPPSVWCQLLTRLKLFSRSLCISVRSYRLLPFRLLPTDRQLTLTFFVTETPSSALRLSLSALYPLPFIPLCTLSTVLYPSLHSIHCPLSLSALYPLPFIPLCTLSTALSISLFLRPSSVLSYFFHVQVMHTYVVPKQNITENGTCAKDQATSCSQSRGVQKMSPQPVTSVSAGSTSVRVTQQTWCNMLTVRDCWGQVDDNWKRTGNLVLLRSSWC